MWFNMCFFVTLIAAHCSQCVFAVCRPSGRTVQNNKQKLVYGGSLLPITEAPYMAQYYGNCSFCDASIIHKDFVISAAHCYRPGIKKYVLVGSSEISKGQRYDVLNTIVHPEYGSRVSINNDVIVIMLSKSLQFSDRVRPIQMAPKTLSLNSGDMLTSMGFGKTEHFPTSEILLKVDLPYITNKDCNELGKDVMLSVTEKMLCAGGVEGQDTCFGDSGGPLVYNGSLVGIVSFSMSDCCGTKYPGVYTRVSAVRDFIDTTIDELS